MPKLHILDVSQNGLTGHITVTAKIIGDDGREGAQEVTGIEALELQQRYAGNERKWLAKVGRDMLQRHHGRTASHAGLHRWKGQVVELSDLDLP